MLTQTEITKNKLIPKIVSLLQPDTSANLIFYCVRILRQFLVQPKARNDMINSDIVQKMINVFNQNPRGVAHFFEELILRNNDKTVLAINKDLLKFLEFNLKEVNT